MVGPTKPRSARWAFAACGMLLGCGPNRGGEIPCEENGDAEGTWSVAIEQGPLSFDQMTTDLDYLHEGEGAGCINGIEVVLLDESS